MAVNDPILRVEYEKRHDELIANVQAQVSRLDTRIDKLEISDAAIKVQLDSRFDKLADKIDASERLLSSQFTSLKDEIYRAKTAELWRVLGWIFSFVLGGGGMVGLFQVFHLLK